jgi:hypothetical protein
LEIAARWKRGVAFVGASLLLAACRELKTPASGDGGGAGGGPGNETPSDGALTDVDIDASIPPDPNREVLDTSLVIDLSAHRGTATITFAPSASTSASLEIGNLDIQAVHRSGMPLIWVDRGATLDIAVPSSTDPLVITVEYTWHVHDSFDGVSSAGYTTTWPYWCGNIFPCRSAPSDGTTFHLQIGGAEAGRVIYPMDIPAAAPSYMAAWAVGNYADVALGTTAAGTQIVMRALPADAAAGKAGTAHLMAAFDWMEKNFGPYLFGSTAGPVGVPWPKGQFGGLEHHPFWHIASAALSDESVQVHEAAHGWFGNGVRLRCWEDFVLSEGTVSYLAAHVLQRVGAISLGDSIVLGYQRELESMRADGEALIAWPQSCGQVDILKGGLYSRVPYVKRCSLLSGSRTGARRGRRRDIPAHVLPALLGARGRHAGHARRHPRGHRLRSDSMRESLAPRHDDSRDAVVPVSASA